MIKRTNVVWQGEIVGYVTDLKADMFDLYGTWIPGSGAKFTEFLERLHLEEELWVTLGNAEEPPRHTIEIVPDHQINFKFRVYPKIE